MKFNKRKIVLLIIPILFLCLIIPLLVTKSVARGSSSGKLTISFIDVLHGDCTLITFPNGKNVLIDCGPENLEINEKTVSYIKQQGVKKLDYLIFSGISEEHVAGAKNILEKLCVDKVFLPNVLNPSNFATYSSILTLINNKSIETETISTELDLNLGCKFKVLSPFNMGTFNSSLDEFNTTINPTDRQIKDISATFYLEYMQKRIVLCSDAGITQEENIINKYSSLNEEINLKHVTMLKVSDHGSKEASSKQFIDYLSPKYAVISIGGNNSYGSPSASTLANIHNVCQDLYRTDVDGTIRLEISRYGGYGIYTEY